MSSLREPIQLGAGGILKPWKQNKILTNADSSRMAVSPEHNHTTRGTFARRSRLIGSSIRSCQFDVAVSGNKAIIQAGFILAQGLHRVDVGTDDGSGHKILPTDLILTAEYSMPCVRIPITNIDGADFFEINTRYITLDQTYIYVPLVRLKCTDWSGSSGTRWNYDGDGSIIHRGYIPLGNEVVFG